MARTLTPGVAFLCLVASACGGDVRSSYVPTTPSRVLPAVEFTTIEVGEVVKRTITGTPPECVELRGWPCQYFEFTAPRDGVLEATSIFAAGTQGGQAVDMTLDGPGGQVWAQTYLPGTPWSEGRLTAPVSASQRYRITLWYTFVNLEYELRTSMLK